MAGLGEHLTELLKGSLIVDKGLLVAGAQSRPRSQARFCEGCAQQ